LEKVVAAQEGARSRGAEAGMAYEVVRLEVAREDPSLCFAPQPELATNKLFEKTR
jgi:hypothetical protein